MYELYAYAGGLLNSFLKWEENGKRESAHSVALMIYRLFNHSQMEASEAIRDENGIV